MRKLKLDLDALEVESFDTDEARPAERGTVHGNALWISYPYGCIMSPLCPPTYQAWCQIYPPIYV